MLLFATTILTLSGFELKNYKKKFKCYNFPKINYIFYKI
jgi:hypothetical protein